MQEYQTWEMFHKAARGKKVFLFGTGRAVRYLVGRCDDIEFVAAIDNNKQKQGFRIGEFNGDAVDTVYENISICDISILDTFQRDNVVVLITNIFDYQDIAEQLRPYGVRVFSMILMEMAAKGREDLGDIIYPDFIERRQEYIQYCCSHTDISDGKILVYIGKYGGHGKNITKSLLQSGQNLDIVWIVNDLRMEVPDGVRLVYEDNWKRYIYEMETARIWLYDIIIPPYIDKRPGQIYIETKHWSSITLKKFYLDDVSTINSAEAAALVKHNGKLMDYILCGSEFDKDSCRSGFAFHGEFIQTGSPRTDTLFDLHCKEKVYMRYNMDSQIHTALYAPTFRIRKIGNEMKRGEILDFLKLKKALEERFGGRWCMLLRLHPSMLADMDVAVSMNCMIDVSNYCDSQELVAACDILISDYSSIMFEPAFVGKPVFLFAADRKEYVEKERDLLIEYDTLPFPIAETNRELLENIQNFDEEVYRNKVNVFLKKYGICEDGHASERAAEFILKCLGEGGGDK